MFTLLLLAASAAAMTTSPPPPYCCGDEVWSSQAAVTFGRGGDGQKGTGYQGLELYITDYTHQKIYIEANTTDLSTLNVTSYKVLQDYANGKQYWIVDSGCYVKNFTTPMTKRCLKDMGAQFMGELDLGGIASTAWSYDLGGVATKVVVDKAHCRPLFATTAGVQEGENSLGSVLFFNYSPSISKSDASKLVAPADCMPAPDDSPKRCCMSKRFSMSATVSGGKVHNGVPTAFKGTENYVVDSDAKIVWAQSALTDMVTGVTDTYTVHQDFNTMKQRVVMKDGNCYIQTLTETMYPTCIPDGSVYLGTHTMGSGAHTFQASAWQWPVTNNRSLTTIFEDETCTPVSTSTSGNFYGENQNRDYLYYDYTPSLMAAEEAKLVPPSGCIDQTSSADHTLVG